MNQLAQSDFNPAEELTEREWVAWLYRTRGKIADLRLLVQGGDRLVYGLGPLWVVKPDGSTSTFARDGGKSIRAEVSAAGAVTASFRYRAYGAIAQSSGANSPSYLGYAGQFQDPSGLLYMRARWYDPNVGRFTTADAANGDPSTPGTLNIYGYASANPMTMMDPSGLAAIANDVYGGCSTISCGDAGSVGAVAGAAKVADLGTEAMKDTAGRYSSAGRTMRTSADAAARSAAAKVLRQSPSALTSVVKSGLFKGISRALPLVGAGLDFAANLAEGNSVGRSAARAVGGFVGGTLGAAVGGAVCVMLVLSIIGAPACIIAPIGLMAAGSFGGEAAGDAIFDALGGQ